MEYLAAEGGRPQQQMLAICFDTFRRAKFEEELDLLLPIKTVATKDEEARRMKTTKALGHNSTLADSEPGWGNVDKTKLPYRAFAWEKPGTDRDKKSTWGFPHHWVKGGSVGENGVFTSGDMFLHRGGLIAAHAAAQGARAGVQAAPAVKAHLERHRKAIGLSKEDLNKMVEKYEKIQEIAEKPMERSTPEGVIAGQYPEVPELPEDKKPLTDEEQLDEDFPVK